MKIVILAGGGGTRLWPLSRNNKPKQFSQIVGDKTMLEQTMDRFLGTFKISDIYICLRQGLKEQAKQLVPDLPEENFIIEPEKRDTAPAMGFVAAKLYNKFPDEPIAYVPSDHFIGNSKMFLKTFQKADHLIRNTGKMLDIAIQPAFPSTVLGYTKIGDLVEEDDGVEVYDFAGHTEKPVFEVAQKYLEDGNYLWHASYYMWTPRKILSAFERYSPEHYEKLDNIIQALQVGDENKVTDEFSRMDKISFDYAVTEKMDPSEVLIIKGNFGWSDVGAFDTLYDAQKRKVDSNNNVVTGRWVGEDTKDCLIYGHKDRMIATVGLNGKVIIDTGDVILICPKSKAQEVKKLVEKIRGTDREDYL